MSTRRKTLFMETTEISAERTAAKISSLLVQAGARELTMQYDGARSVTGLRFVLPVKDISFSFALPVRIEPVFQILNRRRPPAAGEPPCQRGARSQAGRARPGVSFSVGSKRSSQ